MSVTTISASTLSAPRLVLALPHDRAVLDGGWWPRSWDPAAELPGLVLTLFERHGRIRHLMLNIHTGEAGSAGWVPGRGGDARGPAGPPRIRAHDAPGAGG